MCGWLRRHPNCAIDDKALNHYPNVSLEVHSFDYEVDVLCCLLDRLKDSSQVNPTSFDLAQSYYCNEIDLLMIYDLSLLAAGSSFCFMSMSMSVVRPHKQSVTSNLI